MMTNAELKEIKATFTRLERVLSSENSVESLFKNNPDFKDVFTKAYKCLGVLENEWMLKIPRAFDSREAINDVIERIEVIQHSVDKGIGSPAENSLSERLNEVKAILTDINLHLKL